MAMTQDAVGVPAACAQPVTAIAAAVDNKKFVTWYCGNGESDALPALTYIPVLQRGRLPIGTVGTS